MELALFVATLLTTLVPSATGSKTACIALLAAELIGLLLVHGGTLELKPESMELAQDEARAPLSSSDAQRMAHAEVGSAFQSAGFEDIRPEDLHDLGLLQRQLGSKEGRVASIRMARCAEFDKGAIFWKPDMVLIRYHSAKYPLLTRLFQR